MNHPDGLGIAVQPVDVKGGTKKIRLVLVEWVDSHASRGWVTPADLARAAEPLYCCSVGWLLHDKSNCKVMVPHMAGAKGGDTTQVCGDLTIPTKSIVRITALGKRR